jgi:hypothetical protein
MGPAYVMTSRMAGDTEPGPGLLGDHRWGLGSQWPGTALRGAQPLGRPQQGPGPGQGPSAIATEIPSVMQRVAQVGVDLSAVATRSPT